MEIINYRKLEFNDIHSFIKLRKHQLIEEGAAVKVDITDALTDYYRRHLSDGTFVSWLAVVNNEIIATCIAHSKNIFAHYFFPSSLMNSFST